MTEKVGPDSLQQGANGHEAPADRRARSAATREAGDWPAVANRVGARFEWQLRSDPTVSLGFMNRRAWRGCHPRSVGWETSR